MANPLTFLQPLRYDAMGTMLLIQAGPLARTLAVAARLRTLFPGCRVEGLVRASDATAPGVARFDAVTVRRWDERVELLRRLRTRRFAAVVVQLTGSPTLWILPLLLRTDAVLFFNQRLDYVPMTLGRFWALVQHVSAERGLASGARRMATRALVWPAAMALLLASTARSGWRRHRRTRRAHDVVAGS